ncbi:TPA: guanylate kinase [Candidatus Poribacteria bacterium]|jgi:guanylate kinase|nr:guanylate kinase [Candidatus Poribacteria bacterium]
MWQNRVRRQGSIIVISGPSGVGKGSVIDLLCQQDENLVKSISATTRTPRPHEIDGVDYHFVSVSKFKNLIGRSGLVEWTQYGENYYGTLRSMVESTTASGKDLILEIDVDGVIQLRELGIEGTFVFILPPSTEVLANRLRGRGTESQTEIDHRLARARTEVYFAKDYDFWVINADNQIGQTVSEILQVIYTERHRIDQVILKQIYDVFDAIIPKNR